MSYSNATFYVDMESGSDAARTSLTSVAVANNGSGLVRCTKATHGLVTGAVVDVSLNYAGAWIITVIDVNNFDLVGSAYSTATAVTVAPRGGSSKADAWLSTGTGATSARLAAGDSIRIKASTDETLVGNATWTNLSKTVTLAGAVTANISDCETAWTAAANVTATADTTQFKENTKSAKLVTNGSFTTGKIAYFPTGTIDLSAYQQVSFWFLLGNAIADGATLSLRLCSDALGVTTVNTIALPANPCTTNWTVFTLDLATNLGASIQSIALYADKAFTSSTIQLDNIIACKASASADSLTLNSIIGKVWNKSWVASTTYASNDIRKPTQPNRNGFVYKVTAGGGGSAGGSEPTWPQEIGVTVTDGALTWTCLDLEDTWYGIQSINGTTVKLDNDTNCLGNAGQGYAGTTETVATYKREGNKQALLGNFQSTNTLNAANQLGTAAAPITYSGGWNRTDMTTQTGETWLDAQNGESCSFNFQVYSFNTLNNLNSVRCYNGLTCSSSCAGLLILNCHHNNTTAAGLGMGSGPQLTGQGIVANNGAAAAFNSGTFCKIKALTCNNGRSSFQVVVNLSAHAINYMVLKNNNASGSIAPSNTNIPINISNLVTSNNVSSTGIIGFVEGVLNNCSIGESTIFYVNVFAAYQPLMYIYSQKHQQTANSHLITADGGTIISATDQRHTASGISWKFRPTNVSRSSNYPLRLSVAKFACTANATANVNIWTYRDNTNIKGTLKILGGQIAGVQSDISVACAPSINTWTQSSALTFTPTETGVVEIIFEVYDGVGTTNNFWIDDLTVV